MEGDAGVLSDSILELAVVVGGRLH